ncbi:hypothetical protein [Protofrankia coriariae]|uniref:DNA primase n=1 Tax=Protofrankia coriariae TaxID=1562887 RepID=A0ABR5F240_9ACTN|nr:hypothetical protein [Protofrankia coriariae]KLL10784.1 hypothetical protein FrCorBMG51_15265 [Protofrankia coriariae]
MTALTLADIADENAEVAFMAFRELVGPALWAVIVRDVHRAKPGTCACRPDRPPMFDAAHSIPGPLCPRCTDLWTPRFMDGFDRIRAALVGNVPTIAGGSNAGQEVRELIVVRDHLVTPEAEWQEAAVYGAMLCDPAFPRGISPEPPGWLRAVWAQFVHFPTAGRIVPTVRRESAAERGLPTRPEVAISTAEWAAPLRADPIGQNIVIHFLLGLRDGVTDPFSLPKMQLRFGLTEQEVDERLRRSLALLRRHNPDFYTRAVALPLAERPTETRGETGPDGCTSEHVPSFEDACVAETDAYTARETIIAELVPHTPISTGTGGGAGIVIGTGAVIGAGNAADVAVGVAAGSGHGRRRARGVQGRRDDPGPCPGRRPKNRPMVPRASALVSAGSGQLPEITRGPGTAHGSVCDAAVVRLLSLIVDVAHGGKGDIVSACRRELGLNEQQARDEAERFARLVAVARVDWVDVLLRGVNSQGVK